MDNNPVEDIQTKRSLWQKLFSSRSRIFGIIALVVMVVAVPLTVTVSQQEQQTKQEAASVTCATKYPQGRCQYDNQGLLCTDGYESNLCPLGTHFRCCKSGWQTPTTTSMPSANPIKGDIDKDNQMTILDYTILMSCSVYSQDNKALCSKSTDYITLSDLDNNGTVDQIDYNLFLREYAAPSPSPTPSPSEGTTTAPTTGLMQLDNLVQHPSYSQYYHLPPPPSSGAYKKGWRTCDGMQWGGKELVEAIVTVATRWKQKYPNGYIVVWDLASKNHLAHQHGHQVDITASTNGHDCVANFVNGGTTGTQWKTSNDTTNCKSVFNGPATVELGKMIVDTNVAIQILFANGSIMEQLDAYSLQTGLSRGYGFDAIRDGDHVSHFHVTAGRQPTPDFAASCI